MCPSVPPISSPAYEARGLLLKKEKSGGRSSNQGTDTMEIMCIKQLPHIF